MPIGPGKYGARAEAILRDIDATLVIVIVLGPEGPGFDVCTDSLPAMRHLPDLLREVATDLDATIKADLAALNRDKPS
jgi:hypothetical protein